MEAVAVLYIALQIFCGGTLMVLVIATLRHVRSPGGWQFVGYLTAVAIIIFSFFMLGISRREETAFFWARLRFLGLTTITPFLLLFVLEYTGRRPVYFRLISALLFTIPAIAQIVLWSDQVIPLFFIEWSLRQFSFLTVESSRFGLWFQLHMIGSFILLIIAYYHGVVYLASSGTRDRDPLLWVLVGNLAGTLVSIIPAVVGNTLTLNPTIVGHTIAVSITAWGFFRYRMFQTLTVAYEHIFLSFHDPVLVLTHNQQILNWNRAAQDILGSDSPIQAGKPVDALLARNGCTEAAHLLTLSRFDLSLHDKTYDAQISPLSLSTTSRESVEGRLLVLRDITALRQAETARQKTEALYRLLAENSNDMIMLNGLDGRFIYASPSCTHATGYTADELLAMTAEGLAVLIHPEDRTSNIAYYMRILLGEQNPPVENRIVRKDKSWFWGELDASIIVDESGTPTHVMSGIRNIDERKRFEQSLQASNQRYDTLVSNIPAMVYQLQRDPAGQYRFTYVSPTAFHYTGFFPEQILQEPTLMFTRVHPDDQARFMAAQEESARNLAPFRWEGRGRVGDKITWMRLESTPQRLDDGTIVWNGVHSDITAQKEAELALEQSRKLTTRIASLLPDTVHVFDLQSRDFLFANRPLNELFGYEPEELAGVANFLEKLMHPEDYQKELTFGNRYATLQDHEVIETEYRWIRKSGEIIWLNVRETVYERAADGTVIHILGTLRDVTDRREAEEERQQALARLQAANRDLKDFAYVISHDLKAPLRGVSSIAHWLSNQYADRFDEEGRELLPLLVGRTTRMEQMINGVLEYSRIGRERERHSPVDLNLLLQQIVDDIVPADRIHVHIAPGMPTLTADPTRIRQVFQNLIDNAVKFMDKSIGEIHIGCSQEGGMWEFSVRDNGPGIPSEHYDRVFQLFQTLVPKDQVESTGVGLAVTKRIIEQYNGKIWIESQKGHGTTFYFTLQSQ